MPSNNIYYIYAETHALINIFRFNTSSLHIYIICVSLCSGLHFECTIYNNNNIYIYIFINILVYIHNIIYI